MKGQTLTYAQILNMKSTIQETRCSKLPYNPSLCRNTTSLDIMKGLTLNVTYRSST